MYSLIRKSLERLGVDTPQLVTLLGVYLKQDFRRQGSTLRFGKTEAVIGNKAVLFLSGVYIFMGLVIGIADVTMQIDVFGYCVILLSFTMFVTALSVIAESSNVIFNDTEIDVIGHMPVNDRTLFLAKGLSLLAFSLVIGLSFNLFPSVLGIWAVRSGLLFCIIHPITAVLVSVFATSLALVSYGVLMRLAGKERFDSIVTYSQIVLTLIFMFGYQIMPRLLGATGLSISSDIRWFHLLYPPAWYAGLTMSVLGHASPIVLALAACGLFAVTALAYAAVRKVSTGYSASLSKLTYDSTKERTNQNKRRLEGIHSERSIVTLLKNLLLRKPVERAVFSLVTAYFTRNREIKIRVYPTLSYFIVFPLMGAFSEKLNGAMSTFWILMGAAMVPLVGLTAIEALAFCEHYPAAHIFRITPVAHLGEIHSGLRKAAAICTVLPCFGIILILFWVVFHSWITAVLLIIPWLAVTPTILMLPFFFKEVISLAKRYRKGEQSARIQVLALLSFIILGTLVGLQTAAFRSTFPYWIFVVTSVIVSPISYLAARSLSRESRPLIPSESSLDSDAQIQG